ncbi:MAG: hypothetical protein IPM35_27970 [Myxococcales bacterium]|nr:hypothetical protein [Myxococcales bacterium]
MTSRNTDLRAAELAATPWPSPPGHVRHPQAAWEPGETCNCDECFAACEALITKEMEMTDNNKNDKASSKDRTCVECNQPYDGDDADSIEFSPITEFYRPEANMCLACWLGVGPLDFPDGHAPPVQGPTGDPT